MSPKRTSFIIIAVALIADIVFIVAADLASFIIRFNGRFPAVNFNAYLRLSSFIVVLRLLSFYILHLYDKPKHKSNFEMFINTVRANTASSVVIVVVTYFLDITAYPRSIIFISWIMTTLFVSGWRIIVKDFVELYLGKDFFRSHLLIVGAGEYARDAAYHAFRDAAVNYKFLGFIDPEIPTPVRVKKEDILGTIEEMPSVLQKYPVDEVILADPDIESQKIARLVRIITPKKILIRSIPTIYENVVSRMVLQEQGIPFLGPTIFNKPASWYWGLKRILDIIFSAFLLLLTSPVLLLAAISIKATSPGPVFYFQKRTGQNGRRFIMYKLRTMCAGAEKGGVPRWTKRNDVRITPIGKVLRHTRIDELPQLVNVLKNDMSIIGPRPERPSFTSKLIKKIPFYAERLQVKPGITGWAQVNFRYTASEKDTEQKLLYDLYYIQNMSFALDFLIALKTLKVVITGRGAQ